MTKDRDNSCRIEINSEDNQVHAIQFSDLRLGKSTVNICSIALLARCLKDAEVIFFLPLKIDVLKVY